MKELKRFGLEDKVKGYTSGSRSHRKNQQIKIPYILGTVGGFRGGIKQEDISLQTILYHTEIQIGTLIEEGVDALLSKRITT